jgi:hypothetical protein
MVAAFPCCVSIHPVVAVSWLTASGIASATYELGTFFACIASRLCVTFDATLNVAIDASFTAVDEVLSRLTVCRSQTWWSLEFSLGKSGIELVRADLGRLDVADLRTRNEGSSESFHF